MFKILRFLSGPYEDSGYVWCVAEVEDADGIREEEIYYDCISEAYADIQECGEGITDEYDEYLTEEEEELLG